MSREPSPPITVYDNGDLEVYPDLESARAALEVYDLDDLWLADRHGYSLRAETRGYDVTALVLDDTADPMPQELADRLRAFIERVGPQRVGLTGVGEAPIEMLLSALLRFFSGPPEPPSGV